MRHTLLPLNERKKMRRDYFIRLIIVACFLISIAGLVGAAALFPAYIHARDMEQTELDAAQVMKASKEVQNRTAIESELRADATLIDKLAKDIGRYRTSEAIQSIVKVRGTTQLTSFSFVQNGTTTATVIIQGTAPTRNELLAMKSRIESAFLQTKVELPLSELAKSKDIDFSMKITFKLP